VSTRAFILAMIRPGILVSWISGSPGQSGGATSPGSSPENHELRNIEDTVSAVRQVSAGPRVKPGEDVEERGDVVAEIGMAGEESDVRVDLRRHRVVVAGWRRGRTPQLLAFRRTTGSPCRWVFQPATNPKTALTPDSLASAGQIDVVLFVEPGLQLDDRRHLFAVLGGPRSRPDDRGNLYRSGKATA